MTELKNKELSQIKNEIEKIRVSLRLKYAELRDKCPHDKIWKYFGIYRVRVGGKEGETFYVAVWECVICGKGVEERWDGKDVLFKTTEELEPIYFD